MHSLDSLIKYCPPAASATAAADALESGTDSLHAFLADEIYCNSDPGYLKSAVGRYADALRFHSKTFGDQPTHLLRAPGRLNAFLEYLDMCAGDHMSTTIDGDIPVCVSVRDDDTVRVANVSNEFAGCEFSISEELKKFLGAGIGDTSLEDNWDARTRVHPHFNHKKGDWMNYVRGAFLRAAYELNGRKLRGADITFGESSIPLRGGTSSSSAIVVLSFLAFYLANREAASAWSVEFVCRLLGEAEWYVGTHGGANDQTTILRSIANGILYNRHSRPTLESDALPFLQGARFVVAHSLWEASKAMHANHVFNLRKGWMDLGDDIMRMLIAKNEDPAIRQIAPKYNKFGSLDSQILGAGDETIAQAINLLPEEISPEDAAELLGKDIASMERDYTLPASEEGGYRPRAAAIFFHNENKIGRELERIFIEADSRLRSGEIYEDSAQYDAYRIRVGTLLDSLQQTLRDDFQVSNYQLDLLLHIAESGPGYLGGKLTGAGSGGCVSVMVRKGCEQDFCEYLDERYYSQSSHFDVYREAISQIGGEAAAELLSNLESALSDFRQHRRIVTFSAGVRLIDTTSYR